MSALMLGLLAESHIHPGTGQEDETVDLPVARERTTGYPVIVGSSVKGGLKEFANSDGRTGPRNDKTGMTAEVERWFGIQDAAGRILVGDARLLLLPVRSLTGAYRWLTCPHLIERLARDCRRAGAPEVPLCDMAALERPTPDGAPPILTAGSGRLFLEERSFTVAGAVAPALVAALARFIGDKRAAARLPAQLAIVADDQFAWFARHALSVQARNALDPERKTSTNLWYEETLPPDTVFHLLLASRTRDADADLARLRDLLADQWIQLGGNETVGQGWFLARIVGADTGEG